MYYNEAAYNKNDGTIVYIKNDIETITETIELTEISLIQTNFKTKNTNYVIYSMYRPPSTSATTFVTDLHNLIQKSEIADINIIIGDMNINILKQESITNEYVCMLANAGFESYINEPTRQTETTSTCIDHCFIKIKSNKNMNTSINSYILQTSITDHYTQVISFECEKKY